MYCDNLYTAGDKESRIYKYCDNLYNARDKESRIVVWEDEDLDQILHTLDEDPERLLHNPDTGSNTVETLVHQELPLRHY